MAGLLAARVLSESFERVIVLDRDDLSPAIQPRGGVPHGRHTHGLLAKGCEVLEELLPGLIDELVGAGAVPGDLQAEMRWYFSGRPLKQRTSGLRGLAVSRPLLEHHVRWRVGALTNIDVRSGQHVRNLVLDDSAETVCGVLIEGAAAPVPADLVVDASGRTSKLPKWLCRLGYPAPAEERVRIDVSYATRAFSRRPGALDGDLGMVFAASPESPRAAALLAQEHGRWIVSLGGYHGDVAPLDLEGFLSYADKMHPELGQVLRSSAPLDDGAYFRFPASVRSRFDRLDRFPEALVVVGDAMCSFNPVFGQGMTVAALEAMALRDCLAKGRARLGLRFFKSARPIVDAPWQIAVSADLQIRGTPGKASTMTKVMNRYVSRLQGAAHEDADLAEAFLRVANLKDSPQSLMAPRRLVRVLRRRARPPVATEATAFHPGSSERHRDRAVELVETPR